MIFQGYVEDTVKKSAKSIGAWSHRCCKCFEDNGLPSEDSLRGQESGLQKAWQPRSSARIPHVSKCGWIHSQNPNQRNWECDSGWSEWSLLFLPPSERSLLTSLAYLLDEEGLCAGADFERDIPCDHREEKQDVRTEMVPVSTANSLTARDSQHLHSYGDDRGVNSPVAEVVDVFRWTKQQHTPPADRSAQFADPDLTSDYEEFDSTFVAQPPPSLLLANSVGATQMDAFIQTSFSFNAPESHLSSARVSNIARSSNVDLMRHHATSAGTASECSPGDGDGYTSHDEAPWLVDQHAIMWNSVCPTSQFVLFRSSTDLILKISCLLGSYSLSLIIFWGGGQRRWYAPRRRWLQLLSATPPSQDFGATAIPLCSAETHSLHFIRCFFLKHSQSKLFLEQSPRSRVHRKQKTRLTRERPFRKEQECRSKPTKPTGINKEKDIPDRLKIRRNCIKTLDFSISIHISTPLHVADTYQIRITP